MAKKAKSKKGATKKPSSRKKASKAKGETAPSKVAKAKKTGRATSRTNQARTKGATPAPRQIPDIIGLQSQHVDFLSYKVDQVSKFYGEILGFRTERRESDLNYLFVQTTESSSIGFMPPHPQMIGEQPPPREPTLYFLVEDVDHAFAVLMARGVAFMGPPQEMPWGHRVITTSDPEGRTVMLGSEIKRR
jgi:predicted enzyme related to lactoylglutathione lyase